MKKLGENKVGEMIAKSKIKNKKENAETEKTGR